MWHDAENQTVVKYINYEQYGSLNLCHPASPQGVSYLENGAFYVEPKSSVYTERIQS